jgi:magnesium transporter
MSKKTEKVNQPQTQHIIWNELTWTDISFPTRNEADYLGRQYHFHPLSLEDSLSHSQLSKVDDYQTYLLLVLHFPTHMPGEMALKSTWLCAFIGSDYLITLHDEFPALASIFTACQTRDETRQEYFGQSSGYLLYRLLDDLIESCIPILDKLLTRIDTIEDSVFDETTDDTQSIAILRRDIITFKRIIWSSRPVLSDLIIKIKPFTRSDMKIYFDNLLDHVNYIWENLEESKEVIEVFKDSDFVLVTNRINRIVQTLTIVSSIVLPFIVVSSLYGMNVNLPWGLQTGNLATFGVLLAIMSIISGSMLYFFHRRHWI